MEEIAAILAFSYVHFVSVVKSVNILFVSPSESLDRVMFLTAQVPDHCLLLNFRLLSLQPTQMYQQSNKQVHLVHSISTSAHYTEHRKEPVRCHQQDIPQTLLLQSICPRNVTQISG